MFQIRIKCIESEAGRHTYCLEFRLSENISDFIYRHFHALPQKIHNLLKGQIFACKFCKNTVELKGFEKTLYPFSFKNCPHCGQLDGITYFGNVFSDKYAYRKNYFNSFFDTSTGTRIESLEQIKNFEKQGKLFISHEEAVRETRKYKKQQEDAMAKKRRDNIENKVRMMRQGYSWEKHMRERGLLKS